MLFWVGNGLKYWNGVFLGCQRLDLGGKWEAEQEIIVNRPSRKYSLNYILTL